MAKYFTPREVSFHNTEGDLWVSFLGKVHDLTELCEAEKVAKTIFSITGIHSDGHVCKFEKRKTETVWLGIRHGNKGRNVFLKPILQAAGTDISHWFNPKTNDVRMYVDPETNILTPYCPYGRFIHIPPPYPDNKWSTSFGCCWWKDNRYVIGNLSQKTRFIKICNTLTSQEHIIEVCTEEKLTAIRDRYLECNTHADSYTWKYEKKALDMNKTLTQNGIQDEDELFYELRMRDNEFLQTIHLYFNDDLTEK